MLFEPLEKADEESYQSFLKEREAYKALGKEELKTAKAPHWQQLLLKDSTEEARNKALQHSRAGCYVLADELTAFFNKMGQYTKNGTSPEKDNLLKIFNGESLVISRAGADPIRIDKPFMGIFGTTQPDKLGSIFGRSEWDAGLAQRFLFVYFDKWAQRETDEALDATLLNSWALLLAKLRSECYSDFGISRYTFSEEALKALKEFKAEMLKQGEKVYKLGRVNADAIFAKASIHLHRLALIAQVVLDACRDETACDDADIETEGLIGVLAVEYAARQMKYFLQSACMVYEKCNPAPITPVITKGAAIRALGGDIKNQSLFAKSLGKSRQWINNILRGRD